MLIVLKRVSDKAIAVHPLDIRNVEDRDADMCRVLFQDGTSVYVDEPFEAVVEKINNA